MTKKNTCFMLVAVGALVLLSLFAGYFAGIASTDAKVAQHDALWSAKLEEAQNTQENYRSSYEADIDGLVRLSDNLRAENAKLRNDVARLEGSDYENYSDWIDCCASLKYINGHLEEIDKIDATNPVPIIHLKDGRMMRANGSHVIAEFSLPEAPANPVPPPTPGNMVPDFPKGDVEVENIAYLGN